MHAFRTAARATLLFVLFCASLETSVAQSADRDHLRILTYNIHHGEGMDGKVDLERIAKVIRDARPDLVALQEVDRGTRRTGGVDQPAELARLTGMTVRFERNIPYQGGDYGNAVLTRLEIVRHENHLIPNTRPGEQRGALEVEVRVPAGEEGAAPTSLRFFATHWAVSDETERLASAALLRRLTLTRKDTPAVLAGDLNAVPGSDVITEVLKTWGAPDAKDLLTFPSLKPVRQIDYVLHHPKAGWRCIDARVLDASEPSDHRPLLVVLERVNATK
jgi:endonuclease/exonuclease/phosphatase family metal-dependent hydrolase